MCSGKKEEGGGGVKGKSQSQNFSLESWLPCISLAGYLSLCHRTPIFSVIKWSSLLHQLLGGSKETLALLLNYAGPCKYSLIFSRESMSDISWHPNRHQNKQGVAPECSVDSPGAWAGSRDALKESLAPTVLYSASLCCSWAQTREFPRMWSLAHIAVSLRACRKALLSKEKVWAVTAPRVTLHLHSNPYGIPRACRPVYKVSGT